MNHILQIHVIKATRTKITCTVLVIISTYFTLFYSNYKEPKKPEGIGLCTRPGNLYIWGHSSDH